VTTRTSCQTAADCYATQAELDSGAAQTAIQQGNENSVAAGLAGLSKAANQGYDLLKQPGDNSGSSLTPASLALLRDQPADLWLQIWGRLTLGCGRESAETSGEP